MFSACLRAFETGVLRFTRVGWTILIQNLIYPEMKVTCFRDRRFRDTASRYWSKIWSILKWKYRQCPPKWSPTKMIAGEAREKKMKKPKWSLKWSLQNDRCLRQKNENRNDRRNDRAKMIAAALKIYRNEMIAKWSLLALKIDSTCSNSNSDSQRVLVTSGFGLCLEFLSALSSYYGY